MSDPSALRLTFALDQDGSSPLAEMRPPNALSVQLWLGQQTPWNAAAPMRQLLLCDLPQGADAGIASTAGLWTWLGDQITPGALIASEAAGGLLCNVMTIPPTIEEEFNEWYDKEHLVRLLQVPGVLSARRFRALDGAPRYAAFYHLVEPEVQVTAAWKEAATTPWTTRMQRYRTENQRLLFRRG